MNDNEFRSIYAVSGQAWKITVAGLCFVGGLAFTILRWLDFEPIASLGFWGDVVSVAVTLGVLGFACRAIRCPDCDARWIWMAVSERDHRTWLTWLLGLEFCPRCGYGSRSASKTTSG